ncbi:MAG: toxic anion resistance protein [Spirochaetales bacterium]|nr:toxic anion resistance protein [Spirochaetales bacterium]
MDVMQEITTVQDASASHKVKAAAELAKTIDVTDAQQIEQYAVGIQSKISDFSDSVLINVRSKDTGYVGIMMSELLGKIKGAKVDELSPSALINNIPIFGKLFNRFKQFVARYEKIEIQIDKIISSLDKARMDLLKDIGVFDMMFDRNKDYFKELEVYIAAGEMKVKELNTEVIPQMKRQAEESDDPMVSQRANDMVQLTNRFEKKVHDLKLSKTISLQMAPQIRLVQNNNRILVDKIQTSILNTIPLWKNQVIIAMGIFKQSNALKTQQEVDKMTNDMLLKNSQMLKETTAAVVSLGEKGIVEVETLKKVNADLIATLEETIAIQEKGKQARKEAEAELVKIESELKNKLVEI